MVLWMQSVCRGRLDSFANCFRKLLSTVAKDLALALRLERTQVQWFSTCVLMNLNLFSFDKDPYKSFGMPSIGRLEKYIEPSHIDQVSLSLFYLEYNDFLRLSTDSCAQKWIHWLINFILPNVIFMRTEVWIDLDDNLFLFADQKVDQMWVSWRLN